jgi:hypothetical protein
MIYIQEESFRQRCWVYDGTMPRPLGPWKRPEMTRFAHALLFLSPGPFTDQNYLDYLVSNLFKAIPSIRVAGTMITREAVQMVGSPSSQTSVLVLLGQEPPRFKLFPISANGQRKPTYSSVHPLQSMSAIMHPPTWSGQKH